MFEVENHGGAAPVRSTFRIKFHAAAGLEDCDMTVTTLSAGGNQYLTCPGLQIDGNTGNYPVKATVDADSEIAESNEDNNVMELTLTLVGN